MLGIFYTQFPLSILDTKRHMTDLTICHFNFNVFTKPTEWRR